jgi:hypothetical protein
MVDNENIEIVARRTMARDKKARREPIQGGNALIKCQRPRTIKL